MKLTMLGTGNALVTEYYNTCFIMEDNGQLFMVDGGGGNTVLHQLKHAGFDWMDVRHIFVTHKHIDHLLGIIWMVRMICQFLNHGEYKGEAYIYSHKEVVKLIYELAERLLLEKEVDLIGKRHHLVEVKDGESLNIIGHNVTFFDIKSTKATQFGFSMQLDKLGNKLICCGDEPLTAEVEEYAQNAKWLLHEAFCLRSQADIFDLYEKHHSTVKAACELAERLGIENLLLYHTEDKTLPNRKKLYQVERKSVFSGNIWIPDDLDSIVI